MNELLVKIIYGWMRMKKLTMDDILGRRSTSGLAETHIWEQFVTYYNISEEVHACSPNWRDTSDIRDYSKK